ncbi:hypothetical protein LCGC14_1979240 [marine sediment metagenome]|uniref:Uncharacterized protein n=1 Tax=marine sediment metagenome TaxID=412755 RepID=A0A0F9F9E8_9ZZZZ
MSHEGCEIVVSEWDIIHKCYFFDGFDVICYFSIILIQFPLNILNIKKRNLKSQMIMQTFFEQFYTIFSSKTTSSP